jgi:ABC-type amino acid transport substrate-binding protein
LFYANKVLPVEFTCDNIVNYHMSVPAGDSKQVGWRSHKFVFSLIPWRPPGSTRFKDVFFLISATVIAGIFLAALRATSLWSQISVDDAQERQLREEVSAIRQRISDSKDARSRAEAELRVPHPILTDRDANVIGNHTNVSWNYLENNGKHVSYELQLNRLKLSQKCDANRDLLGCNNGTRFIATDPVNQTSRIPPDNDVLLTPGTYAWRVAAVPIGAAAEQNTEHDDPKRLSDWSAYATFSIQPSIMMRILSTGHIRVGTNLEQNTHFARRARDGRITGFDVSLIDALLEGCLHRQIQPVERLFLDEGQCRDYIKKRLPGDPHFFQGGSCQESSSDANQLCYDLIPVAKWVDWEGALRRKEIDLFIGGVTASVGREGRGISFTRPYLTFQSKIYVRTTDLKGGRSSLGMWLTRDRLVGAVSGSSNEFLLNEIIAQRKKNKTRPQIKKPDQTFRTYPALESAMDRGELDGILIDETFADHDDWTPLADLSQTEPKAYSSYIKTFVGSRFGTEQIAIAVAADNPGTDNLSQILNREIQTLDTQGFISTLCNEFWPESSGYRCRIP